MAKLSRPRRGSLAFYPRVRARSWVPKIRSWPEVEEGPRIQAFAGYKAGMTYVYLRDHRRLSSTAGMDVWTPVTVIETPPMLALAVRLYERTPYGLRTLGEVWAPELPEFLSRRFPIPKEYDVEAAWARLEGKMDRVSEVRFIMGTQPWRITGVPKKVPDLVEIRIGGGGLEERISFARERLGTEFRFDEFGFVGKWVDVLAVTKGKGFQGHVKRFGVKLLHHKNRKHRRMIGTLGPWHPDWVRWTVPQAGQTGFHQRTEFNKLILKIGEDGSEVIPKGGFLHYGVLREGYVILKGSVPGPAKRLIVMRDAVRPPSEREEVDLRFVYTGSQQGVRP